MDFSELGFKCGIEIHNRLATRTKLFCGCAPRFGFEAKEKFERKLRAVAGELGNIDPAAMHEYLRGRKFVYYSYENTCLVEMDEEPPHDLNSEAGETALQVALMLNSEVPHEIHMMRKTVIDGSNTSGFQRTGIIGRNGVLKTSKGPVSIDSISLEEESAGIVEQKNGLVVYRLDRLGIPLIEIGTGPDIKDSEHAQEVAAKLGMLIRSTGKSQRGIGSTRQDVNVSIKKGARVEIKGVQELWKVKEVIDKEVLRQVNLLKIKEELNRRKASVGTIEDVTDIFKWSSNSIIKNSLRSGEKVYGLVLRGFAGILKQQLHEGKYFAKELVDHVKSFGVPGFFHSDEDLEKYNIEDEFKILNERWNCKESDAVAVLAGNYKAITALKERCEIALKRIPEETRVANSDGSTSFNRPLPGSARMYPETDVKPIFVRDNFLRELRKKLPETWEQKFPKFSKVVSGDLARQILASEYLQLFEKLYRKSDAAMLASILTSTIKSLERDGFNTARILDHHIEELLQEISAGRTAKESVSEILKFLCNEESEGLSVKEAVEKLGLKSISREELKLTVKKVINEHQDLALLKHESALMGLVMKEVRGKADGKLVAEILKEELSTSVS